MIPYSTQHRKCTKKWPYIGSNCPKNAGQLLLAKNIIEV